MDIVIANPYVSNHHFDLQFKENHWFLTNHS